MEENNQKTSKTLIRFDLADELTAEEIERFEEAAKESGAESITEHFLNITLRVDPPKVA